MTEASPVVRAATSDDVAALSAFAHRTFVATYAHDNPPGLVEAQADRAFTPAVQAAELADPTITYRLAERDGALVGYLMLADTPAPDVVEGTAPLQLSRLYVDAAAHRAGVGTTLVAEAVRVAAGRGHDLLWLTVWTRNPRAVTAYTRWGFVEVGTTIFDMAGDRQVDHVMVRPVPAGTGR